MKYDDAQKEIIFVILNQLKKKKSMIIQKLRYFNIKSKEMRRKNLIKQKCEIDKKKNINKLQIVIKMLINENIMNKKEIQERMILIEQLKNEIKDNKFDLEFVKDNYTWVFLRRIQDIIDKNNMTEILQTFDQIKNHKL